MNNADKIRVAEKFMDFMTKELGVTFVDETPSLLCACGHPQSSHVMTQPEKWCAHAQCKCNDFKEEGSE